MCDVDKMKYTYSSTFGLSVCLTVCLCAYVRGCVTVILHVVVLDEFLFFFFFSFVNTQPFTSWKKVYNMQGALVGY